jgi:hypothetical protein
MVVTKENTELTISATVGHVSTPVKAGASKTGDAEDCISTPVKAPASKKKATASKKGDGDDWDSVIQRLCSQPSLLFLLSSLSPLSGMLSQGLLLLISEHFCIL